MICNECGAKISNDEDVMVVPGPEGKLYICEVCWNADLDKPVSGEKEGTQTSQTTKEWWV